MPEAEVGALDDDPRVQRVHQHLPDEELRGLLRELGGERQHQHRVHTELRDQLGPARVRREQRRVAARPDDLAGVRVEGHHDRGDAEFAGALDRPPDDQLMSAVHPVERADGDDAASPVPGDLLQATPALHLNRSLFRTVRTFCTLKRSKPEPL